MRGTLFCIVQHLAHAIPRETIDQPLFCIVRHLPNVVPSRTMQNNAIPIVLLGMQLFCICQMQYRAKQWRTMQSRLFYSVRLGSIFAKCRTMRCNGIQCPPRSMIFRVVLLLYIPHTRVPPHPTPCNSHPKQCKKI